MLKIIALVILCMLFFVGCAALKNTSRDPNNPANPLITGIQHVGIAAGTSAVAVPEPYSTVLLLLSTVAAAAVAVWKHKQLDAEKKKNGKT